MSQRNKPALPLIAFGLAALGALLFFSVRARWDRGSGEDAAAAVTSVDPMTGAILVDLHDGASDADHERVAGLLARAIAPFAWPTDRSALGHELSDPANLFRLTAPWSEVADVLAALERDPAVEAVEVERSWSLPVSAWQAPLTGAAPRVSDDPGRFVPNDPYYGFQWHLDQIGMPEAWTRNRGEGVVVAVIDTGVAFRDEGGWMRAPDLADTRFVPGYDFVRNDPNPDDEHGHGTHVAGTIAQSTNNGVGVAGVAPEATIMPLKVLDANGSGGWGGIAAAIRYAADNGAHVINMSLGGGMSSRAVQRAIDHAHSRGVLVVAAAGNSARGRVEYPARHDHVVAVGAVRYDRDLSFYSNYGQGLDLVAPGGDLRVDQNGDGMPDGVLQNTMVAGDPQRFDYLAWQGTSMATPHVAGVAALIYSAGVRDPDTVEQMLKQSATDLGDAHRFGSGLVSANHALMLATQGTSSARGLAALGLALFFALALRRRASLGALASTSAWSVAIAGGLGILPWGLLPVVGAALGTGFSLGALGSLATAFGPWGAPFVLSVGPAFGAVALLLHVERLRPLLVGLCFGSAGFLVVEAVWPTMSIGVLPDVLVGPWLVVNGALAAGLGVLVARMKR
ncbi:MAG: S8 family serine peptidase [Sandaracinaceae bacterium]|nr:S8 family serine peptidase [Sandaracinaceae bacterium]